MENKEREAVNKEALLNKALESEFSDDSRHDTLMDVAQDYLRDKLFYLGCAKIYGEAGNSELADEYVRRAEWVDEAYLEPLTKILGERLNFPSGTWKKKIEKKSKSISEVNIWITRMNKE